MLHVECTGTPGAPRLVLVHGFTQTCRSWLDLATRLSPEHELLLVDAPGHGGSTGVRCGLWAAADLLTQAGGPALYIGYSMGARLALHAALAHPNTVRGLVLIGGTAGIPDHRERMQRRRDDEQLAVRLEQHGLDRFLEDWLANPLFAGLTTERQQRSDRLRNDAAGLAASLRLCGTGEQEDLWPRLHELRMPVLLLTGENDEKFSEIATRMHHSIGPSSTLRTIPHAGHTAHLEQPETFVQVLQDWLSAAQDPR